MVAFRIGTVEFTTLDDAAFATVLNAAEQSGGNAQFPVLFSLGDDARSVEPLAVIDELARLAATGHGQTVAMLIGTLRDDLMEAVAAADEG